MVLTLILCFPFFGAAGCVIMCVRALMTSEMKVGGGRTRVTTITKAANPIQFWIQLVLLVLTAVFLNLLGLAFFDHAPASFNDAMRSASRRR